MAEAGDLLVHVRQRLDALTYDAHSQYLLSSLQPSPFLRSPLPLAPVTSSYRRSWLRYTGLTTFYMKLVLLLGTGWLLAMVGIFTFLYALPAAQEDIVLTSTAQVILLLGVYFLGGAAGCLCFGMCADHFGRRPVLLSAMSFWLVVNALTAGAWNYASFVTLRLLAGVGIGGQLALLATLALEYTPTKTRGRITVLSVSSAGLGVFAGVGYGQLASDSMGEGGLGWRTTYGVLSAIAMLFVAVLYLALEESPKYLASVGRTERALYLLEKIETAHGISRQARVTVPTSLYEPPSQRPQVSYEQYLESSSDSDSDFDLELRQGARSGQDDEINRELCAHSASRSYNYAGPGAAKARSRSLRASARRLQSQHQYQVEVCTPTSGDLGTPSDTLVPSANVSFLRGLARRVAVLFSRSLAGRTSLILFFWFVEFTCLSAAIVTTLMMAGTYIKVNAIGTGFEIGDQLFWSAMTFPGLLLAAMMVETVGRRGTLALFVFCGGAVMVVSGLLLEEDGEWFGLSLALGVLVLTTGGTIGSMIPFTGEQFPLLTRALGLSCAAGWGHLGMFAGVYLVLRRVMGDEAWTWHDERVMLMVCGGVSIILIPTILFMGPETRGRDIDASWFHDNKVLQARASGVLSIAPGGLPDQPATRFRGVSKASNGRGNLDKVAESSDGDDQRERELPESPSGNISLNGVALPAPAIYSPTSAALATARSPGDYSSSSCSSSPSGFWQTHSVRHLGQRVKRAAKAIARPSEDKHVVFFPADAKMRTRSTTEAKQTRDGSGDRCDTLPIDDLDQLDSIITEYEYRQHRLSVDQPEGNQPRRQSVVDMLEPVLLEWRRSLSSSLSGSARDLSSSSKASKLSKQEHSASMSTDVRSSNAGRYTIDLDMFDTFTYISTPVLGGDNYSEHEHREPSNLSSASSGEVKQASS